MSRFSMFDRGRRFAAGAPPAGAAGFGAVLSVECRSGRLLEIPAHHPVFTPIGAYADGDQVDPAAVDFESARALGVCEGTRLIVDNVVETVLRVR